MHLKQNSETYFQVDWATTPHKPRQVEKHAPGQSGNVPPINKVQKMKCRESSVRRFGQMSQRSKTESKGKQYGKDSKTQG